MKGTNRIKIVAPNRVHISLLAMDEFCYRKNGGIGFSIDFKNLHIEFERNSNFEVIDSQNLMDPSRKINLLKILKKAKNLNAFSFSIKLFIMSLPDSHLGLGSGTSIFLACLEALFLLNGKSPSPEELISLSGRGGTSGIGVNTYFKGGFIFDLGRKNDYLKHMPSSKPPENISKPLTVISTKMPEWNIGICLVKDLSSISNEKEIEFFSSVCPIPKRDVEETTYHVVFGTLSGILDLDKFAFFRSINAIQKTKWKSSEIDLYGKKLRRAMKVLEEKCDCVGMSSMGPILYFFADDIDEIIQELKFESSFALHKVSVNNVGREISYV